MSIEIKLILLDIGKLFLFAVFCGAIGVFYAWKAYKYKSEEKFHEGYTTALNDVLNKNNSEIEKELDEQVEYLTNKLI